MLLTTETLLQLPPSVYLFVCMYVLKVLEKNKNMKQEKNNMKQEKYLGKWKKIKENEKISYMPEMVVHASNPSRGQQTSASSRLGLHSENLTINRSTNQSTDKQTFSKLIIQQSRKLKTCSQKPTPGHREPDFHGCPDESSQHGLQQKKCSLVYPYKGILHSTRMKRARKILKGS